MLAVDQAEMRPQQNAIMLVHKHKISTLQNYITNLGYFYSCPSKP